MNIFTTIVITLLLANTGTEFLQKQKAAHAKSHADAALAERHANAMLDAVHAEYLKTTDDQRHRSSVEPADFK